MSKRRVCSLGPVVVALIVVVLAFAPAAFAVSSAPQGGNGANAEAATVPGDAKSRPASAATAGPAGLPFSPLDVTLLVGGGGILLGTGVLFGRLRSKRGTA